MEGSGEKNKGSMATQNERKNKGCEPFGVSEEDVKTVVSSGTGGSADFSSMIFGGGGGGGR